MPKAEIISIGTELLLGEILDSNAQNIAKLLKNAGIDLYWMTTVGDNRQRIAEAIRAGLQRSDILLCTGGLGPTIDDMSREGIADGMGVGLSYHEELWIEIQERFKRFGREATENNKRQAFAPEGAKIIDNPNGSAPAFLIESGDKAIVSMPGVPREMLPIMEEQVLPYLAKKFPSSTVIRSRLLHTAAVGESRIDEKIADLEEMNNPTVGMAAHMGAVDIRLTAKADDEQEAKRLLDDLEAEIRARLGDWIYGVDEQDLQGTIESELQRLGWKLGIFANGFDGYLAKLLNSTYFAFPLKAKAIVQNGAQLRQSAASWQAEDGGRIALVAQRGEKDEKVNFDIQILSTKGSKKFNFRYGGNLASAAEWGAILTAETLRRSLLKF